MSELKHIKEISLSDLEKAIAKAVADLTGYTSVAEITSFAQPEDKRERFTSGMKGEEVFSFNLKLTQSKPRSKPAEDNNKDDDAEEIVSILASVERSPLTKNLFQRGEKPK